jgi:hypothetical protein
MVAHPPGTTLDADTLEQVLGAMVEQAVARLVADGDRPVPGFAVTRLHLSTHYGRDGRTTHDVGWEGTVDGVSTLAGTGRVTLVPTGTTDPEAYRGTTVVFEPGGITVDWRPDAAPFWRDVLRHVRRRRPPEDPAWSGIAPTAWRAGGLAAAARAAPPVETPAQASARAARVQAETRRLLEAREKAAARADAGLRSLLSPAQLRALDRNAPIPVVGSHGTRYEVDPWHVDGNVRWYHPDGDYGGRLCCHPRAYDPTEGRLPQQDMIAGQILALRTDEPGWLEAANLYDGYHPPTVDPARILDGVLRRIVPW